MIEPFIMARDTTLNLRAISQQQQKVLGELEGGQLLQTVCCHRV